MAEQGMDGWEGGVLAQLARLSAEYQGSGKACARTWREGAHVPGSYKVWESGCGAMYNPEKRSLTAYFYTIEMSRGVVEVS